MNFSHSSVCSLDNSLLFIFNTFINWFINSSLRFNSFHLSGNISLFLNFFSSGFFICVCDSSHNWRVWSFSWDWCRRKNLNWYLNWIWDSCFNSVWSWFHKFVCNYFSWSWNRHWYFMFMVVMVVLDSNVVSVMISNMMMMNTWCDRSWLSGNLKNIIHGSIDNFLWCWRDTIAIAIAITI